MGRARSMVEWWVLGAGGHHGGNGSPAVFARACQRQRQWQTGNAASCEVTTDKMRRPGCSCCCCLSQCGSPTPAQPKRAGAVLPPLPPPLRLQLRWQQWRRRRCTARSWRWLHTSGLACGRIGRACEADDGPGGGGNKQGSRAVKQLLGKQAAFLAVGGLPWGAAEPMYQRMCYSILVG